MDSDSPIEEQCCHSNLHGVEEISDNLQCLEEEISSCPSMTQAEQHQLMQMLLLMMVQLLKFFEEDQIQLLSRLIAWNRLVMALLVEYRSQIIRRNTKRRLWAYNRGPGLDLLLQNTYHENEFKKRLRVSRDTFEYLCTTLGPVLMKQDTRFRLAIPVERKVMIALTRLATGDTLIGVADSYRVGYATAQQAVLDFVNAVNTKIKSLYIKWPSPSWMKCLAQEFETVQGIPYIIGAIDGSHIPIIASKSSPQEYYNRKGFHSILLQLMVSRECLVWDIDVGWPGSIHDWTLFQRSAGGQRVLNDLINPYCLVADAAYPPRHYMLSPFKGHKDGLSREQYHWNYVQSCTRMPVEQVFGRLKARFRILLKRNDMDLGNVVKVVSACFVIHNLCIVHKDGFDESWVMEAKMELERSIVHDRELRRHSKRSRVGENQENTCNGSEIQKSCEYGIYKVLGASLSANEAYCKNLDDGQATVAVQIPPDATRRMPLQRFSLKRKLMSSLASGLCLWRCSNVEMVMIMAHCS